MKDYYSVLGVDKTSTKDEIKKAFRKLSMEYHPDRNMGDKAAEEKFKELNEAYSVLSDDSKKEEYDNPRPSGHFDPFAEYGFGFNPFAHMQARRPDPNAPRNGQPLGVDVEIPLRVYLFGGRINFNISFDEICPKCIGEGFSGGIICGTCGGSGVEHVAERRQGMLLQSTKPCHSCAGRGRVSSEHCAECGGSGKKTVSNKPLHFDLSSGVAMGSRLVLNGAGRTGLNGGKAGDIVIAISGIQYPNLNKLTKDKEEEFKTILGMMED